MAKNLLYIFLYISLFNPNILKRFAKSVFFILKMQCFNWHFVRSWTGFLFSLCYWKQQKHVNIKLSLQGKTPWMLNIQIQWISKQEDSINLKAALVFYLVSWELFLSGRNQLSTYFTFLHPVQRKQILNLLSSQIGTP